MDKVLAKWTPPLKGWIKINVDASYVEGRSLGVIIVKDHKGNILFATSRMFHNSSPFLAELKALH